MSNVYYSPEKFGLRIVGEAEFSSGSYEFDTSVIWQDVVSGEMFYADDSGCSCPSPFDGLGRDDLTPITKLQDLIDYLEQRRKDCYRYESTYGVGAKAEIDGECADLIQKYRAARSEQRPDGVAEGRRSLHEAVQAAANALCDCGQSGCDDSKTRDLLVALLDEQKAGA